MNIIQTITRKTLINEVAGISTIVRDWAKVLKQEVAKKVEAHREEERKKNPEPEKPKTSYPSSQKSLEDDPFYWKDETGKSSDTKKKNYGLWDWDYMNEDYKSSYYKKSYSKSDEDDDEGFSYKPSKSYGSSSSYGSNYGYGSYGGYGSTYRYIEPPSEVTIDGKDFPNLYKDFAVDKWILKNSTRIEYDHWKSGYNDKGEYIVYFNVPLSSMSESAFIHEIKHAYDDWNRMRSGGKPIRDTWEIKNIYTKDFEKLLLSGTYEFPQLQPIIKNLYMGSKLETPAYLENEYDIDMGYGELGRKLMNFKASTYLNKKGNPAKGLEEEFQKIKKYDIPLFKKFNNVVELLNWLEKYFNKRGKDIFRRVTKMKYVHDRPTYKPYSYEPKKPKGDYQVGHWIYSKDKGWYEEE